MMVLKHKPPLSPLTMVHMRYSPILFHMDVQSVWSKVLCDHHARLNDAALLREVLFAEELDKGHNVREEG
jgi:hypothetical protein